jgi:hypothetical protein
MLAEATPKETVCNNSMSTTLDAQKTRLGELVLKTTQCHNTFSIVSSGSGTVLKNFNVFPEQK